jgi:hypothetical protein
MLCYYSDMQEVNDTDRVREYARLQYIEPAKARHESTVRIVAGEVHKAVHLSNRVPLVCQALKSRKFLDENNLVLEKCEGPPSGMGTRLALTYRLALQDGKESSLRPEWPFLRLRGIAKEVFSSLGGGEAFIRKERERFHKVEHTPRDDQ